MVDDMYKLAAAVGEALRSQDACLSIAESCTGGWVAKVCTDIAGSSGWFDCGFVTYSNHAKQAMLGVAAETLEMHGAVSEQTVLEMAQGALRRSQASWAVAISGIAGPGGGSAGKPVGTVWFAWAGPNLLLAEQRLFKGDRESVRRQSVVFVLQALRRYLQAADTAI